MRLENGEVLLGWPLEKRSLTAGNKYSDGSRHDAIDLAAAVGTPVLATEDGVVEWVQAWDGRTTSGNSAQTYGNAIRIRHEDYAGKSLATLYAHLDRSLVHNGQKVRAGQQIALSGNTGASTGPHLHFEVRWGGRRYNPLCWLDDDFVITPGWRPYMFGPGEHSVFAPPAGELDLHGVDVSRYQNTIDWDAVKASGKVDFAFCRAVSTHSNGHIYEDPSFQRNFAECKRLGIPVGVYYYTYAADRATAFAELAALRKALADRPTDWPVVVDVEDNTLRPLPMAELTDLVLLACDEIKSWGYTPMVYSGRNYSIHELDLYRIRKAGVDVWCADYTGSRPKIRHTIWQHTSKGSVPGIPGNVDCNIAYKDYAAGKKPTESEDTAMVFKPLSWHRLECLTDKPACEIFGSVDTADVLGKLPAGQVLQIIAVGDTVELGGMTGIWYQCNHLAYPAPVYVLALPDRCTVTDDADDPAPTPMPEGITITGKGTAADLLRVCADWMEGVK